MGNGRRPRINSSEEAGALFAKGARRKTPPVVRTAQSMESGFAAKMSDSARARIASAQVPAAPVAPTPIAGVVTAPLPAPASTPMPRPPERDLRRRTRVSGQSVMR